MCRFKNFQLTVLYILLVSSTIIEGNDNFIRRNPPSKSSDKTASSRSPNKIKPDTLISPSDSALFRIGELDTTGLVPLSLEECIRLAVQHNRILKRYRLSDESARIRLKMAESRFVPSGYFSGGRNDSRNDDLGYVINKQSYSSRIGLARALETGGSASLGINNSRSESSNNKGVVNYYTGLGINLNQPLLRGAGLTVNLIPINRAKTYAYISLLTIKQNLIALITRIESNYWDLILVYEDFGIQKQALSRALQLLEINKSLIEAGRMASQEIVQAESDVATREISVANALNDITNAQIQLQDQLDLDKPIYIRPTTQMTFNPIEVNLQECLDLAYQYRPDWLINQKYLEIEKMNLIVAKNDTRYQLDSYASISSNATSTIDIGSTFSESFQFKAITWNIGLSFTFPFNKETLRNGYILQKLSFNQQELYILELYDDIRTDVESAVRTVQYTLNQVKLAQRAKTLTEKKLQLEEEKMRVGRSSNFQVISYQRDLTNAQNSELRKIAAYLIALGDLQQTMGTTLRNWNIEIEEQAE